MKKKTLFTLILAFATFIGIFCPQQCVFSNETQVVPMLQSGSSHNLALKEDGTIWAWGCNSYGQLGDSTFQDKTSPVQVSEITGIASIAAGSSHSLALMGNGTVWAWGSNSSGQLGDGTTKESPIPITVRRISDIIYIACSGNQSLALKKDGTIYYWGNDSRSSDESTCYTRPTMIKVIPSTVSIGITGKTVLALQSNGDIWEFDLPKKNVDSKMSKHPIKDVVKLYTLDSHILALKKDGTVWAWGSNIYDQSDNTIYPDKNTHWIKPVIITVPVIARNLTDIIDIAAADKLSLAVKKDGSLWAWGCLNKGIISSSSDCIINPPKMLSQINGVVSASAGKKHLAVLKKDGSVWCWGGNEYGQLGSGTKENSLTPVQVLNLNLYKTSAEEAKPQEPIKQEPAKPLPASNQDSVDNTEYTLKKAGYKIYVNNEEYTDNELPMLNYNNSTYIPLRKVADLLGVTVTWNAGLQRAEISKSGAPAQVPPSKTAASATPELYADTKYILHKVGYKIMVDNKEYTDTELPILNYEGSTYIPLRKVADLLGVTLTWNAALNRAEITKTAAQE